MAEVPTEVTITVALTEEEAWEFAQFLKRVTWRDYAELCAPHDEVAPHLMENAGVKIQKVLAEAGYAPR